MPQFLRGDRCSLKRPIARRNIHDTFLCVRQNKLFKITSPVWQYFKVSEKDNKIAVCNVCEAEILQLHPL